MRDSILRLFHDENTVVLESAATYIQRNGGVRDVIPIYTIFSNRKYAGRNIRKVIHLGNYAYSFLEDTGHVYILPTDCLENIEGSHFNIKTSEFIGISEEKVQRRIQELKDAYTLSYRQEGGRILICYHGGTSDSILSLNFFNSWTDDYGKVFMPNKWKLHTIGFYTNVISIPFNQGIWDCLEKNMKTLLITGPYASEFRYSFCVHNEDLRAY